MVTQTAAKQSQTGSTRGASYTPIEDLLVSKAFIAASENSTGQKGHAFIAKMHEAYITKLEQQEETEKEAYEGLSDTSRSVIAKANPYDRRSGDSVHKRFKKTIAPAVMKFIGILNAIEDSGTTLEHKIIIAKSMYTENHPELASIDRIFKSWQYLNDKPMFLSFTSPESASAADKKRKTCNSFPDRPAGIKQRKKSEEQEKLLEKMVEKTMKEVGGSFFSISPTFEQGITSFLESQTQLQEERLFMQDLDTPERKEYSKAVMKKKLLELKAKSASLKRQIKELEENSE